MKSQESMLEAWERFNALLKKCPNHGLSLGHQVSLFYNGCSEFIKSQLNFGSGGSFLGKGVDEFKKMLQRLAFTSKGWSANRDGSMPVASVVDADAVNLLSLQLMMLNQKVDDLSLGVAPIGGPQPPVEDVNYVHQGGNPRNFNNYRLNNGGGNYQGYRPPFNAHPNFSYGNPSNAIQPSPSPSPGFGASSGATNVPSPSKSSSDVTNELLKALMEKTDGIMTHSTMRIDKVKTAVVEVTTRLGALEHRVSQIAQAVGKIHQPGQFPSTTIPNPKDCKAIYLRSRTSYESPPMPEVETKEVPEEKKEEEEIEVESHNMPPEIHHEANAPSNPKEVKISFPKVVQKKKLDERFAKFHEIFKRVHLNIPLIEALQQMPGYLKYLKEIMSKKKKMVDYETVNLTENCSAIIQQKMPAMMKDPRSFNISCVIGNDRQTKALCDLGASINLMPLSFFRKLKFGVLKPITITLQMADKSVKFPNGILKMS
ncbi:uncharacterized protein LOC125194660 [Salvia hispanica]|uniref:uncharacterized protein LOC125194660 n=1 Tax=Salvia hispanica TaxID=49212 RepID=UPI0020099FC7|nr:uncharacterized protein LOC125194660 [Salvia hispanica]